MAQSPSERGLVTVCGESFGRTSTTRRGSKSQPLHRKGALKAVTKVAKCIFYMMFGIWISKEDAEDLIGWRTYAA